MAVLFWFVLGVRFPFGRKGKWLGSVVDFPVCISTLGLSSDAASAGGGHPETFRQPASSEVPAIARKFMSVSTLAPSSALPSLCSYLTVLPPFPQESPDASRESMVKLSVSYRVGAVDCRGLPGCHPLTRLLPLLQSKLSAVSLRGIGSPSTDASASAIHGNFAFEGIGDEDL